MVTPSPLIRAYLHRVVCFVTSNFVTFHRFYFRPMPKSLPCTTSKLLKIPANFFHLIMTISLPKQMKYPRSFVFLQIPNAGLPSTIAACDKGHSYPERSTFLRSEIFISRAKSRWTVWRCLKLRKCAFSDSTPISLQMKRAFATSTPNAYLVATRGKSPLRKTKISFVRKFSNF